MLQWLSDRDSGLASKVDLAARPVGTLSTTQRSIKGKLMRTWRLFLQSSVALVGISLVGCAHQAQRPSNESPIFYAGFSRGLGGGYGLEVSSTGALRVWGMEPELQPIQLGRRTLEEIRRFSRSNDFKAAFQILAESGYPTGRSDLPEVGIGAPSPEYGFPVCTVHTAPLAPEVKTVVDWANGIARKYFPDAWDEDIPTSTCSPGEFE